ncbi:murein transglycosylase A [Phreatobacter stygius]|uniref:peptidoglycan lytic exotransglycosylase n=1 Tax=Phreatobacter stygius TaxID=1940610 RepID=A0A4D7B246_9HYPH|nr:MltA domain-containing protein [Phreatobacter stygius]QCI65083.1 transglycosylase [Phreatobacter stygius]
MTSRRVRAGGLAVLAMAGLLSCGRPALAASELLLLLQPQAPAGAGPGSPEAPAVPQQPPGPAAETPAAPADPGAEPPQAAELPLVPPALETHASGFPFIFSDARLEAAKFAEVPGWDEDRHDLAFKPFATSCRQILRARSAPRAAQPIWFALREICPRALDLPSPVSRAAAKAFFEAEFRPARIAKMTDPAGFLTGYYEPEVQAARERSAEYGVAFLARPGDLANGRGATSGGFDARGGAGRWVAGRFLPYFDRGEIEAGALDGRGLEIAWVRDPVDVLFTQIQGSARLRFADGSTLRIGYAAHNGHRYVPVGRVLVERGIATREQMSMDFIRTWMGQNPEAARDVRWQNRSYVFFRVKSELGTEDGPIGGQGVSITDWRSIAIDRNVHAYGTPVFIDSMLPTGSSESGEPFRRLMIAQDTGSAIVGPARGDLFLGTGSEAGSTAGRIRHRADWYVLLPAPLSPEAANVPVPLPRPAR